MASYSKRSINTPDSNPTDIKFTKFSTSEPKNAPL